MKSYTSRVATDDAYVLGEGPIWDAARQRLLWVDIAGGLVLEGSLGGDRITEIRRHQFEGNVGAVTIDEAGRLLVAAQEQLVILDLEGARTEVARIVPRGQTRRLNDGKTDPVGRYLVGTRAFGPSATEELVLLRSDGGVEVIDDDLTLSNGLAWTHAGTRMYSVDTLTSTVWLRDYDPATGARGERRVYLQVSDGYPDGMCSDAEDHLWIAIWGAGEVRRFTPDGTLVAVVAVDAPHTTCAAFAGPHLDTLVITTATDELSESQLAAHPDSGRIFVARVGVAGSPVAPWNPSV